MTMGEAGQGADAGARKGVEGRAQLRVRSSDGREQLLAVNGTSVAQATRRARSLGLEVIEVISAEAGHPPPNLGTTRQAFPLLLFSQELLALLEAGLNLTEALTTLEAKEKHALPRLVLGRVLDGLRQGRNLSDVLASMPEQFPTVYVATVRASERTGNLPASLARYVAYQQQFEVLRKKLVSASIYPAMLLIVGGFVTLFLLGYVVPRFAVVFESAGREMPWLSGVMLAVGKWLHGHWQIGLASLAASTGTLIFALRRPQSRAWLLGQVLRLPFIAPKVEEFRLARFYRAVGLLLAAGIALPRAMSMVAGLLSPAQQPRLASCRQAIDQGQSFAVALAAADLANPVALSLIKVGERSGQMAEMLERSARFADDDFARWVDWTSRLLEPLLMTLIGVVVGTVVVLMYMPIFDLAGSLQ